jgi:PEP-CTERM motif
MITLGPAGVEGRIDLDHLLRVCFGNKRYRDVFSKFDSKVSDEMSRQVRWVLGSIGVMLCFAANPLQAGIMTFNVNLSGVGVLGNTLRVFGTITVDPDQPISRASTTSSLQFQFRSDTPKPFASSYNVGPLNAENLAWNVSGGDLYISRLTNVGEAVGWLTNEPLGQQSAIEFGSGSFAHRIIQFAAVGIEDLYDLKPSGSPDGPNGFLVGRAVPEPSSALLLAGFGAIYSLTRRRRG